MFHTRKDGAHDAILFHLILTHQNPYGIYILTNQNFHGKIFHVSENAKIFM